MKATLTLTNGDVHNFKCRAFLERLDQGMFVLSDAYAKTTLFSCQATDVHSYQSTGTPKPPKQPKKNSSVLARLLDEMKADDVGLVEILKQRITPTTVKGESLTLDITATTAEAFLEEVNKLLDDEDSHLLSILVEKIGNKLTDRFSTSIDSQAMSIAQIASNLGNLQVAVQALQQPVISTSQAGTIKLDVWDRPTTPPIQPPAPAPMPTPVATVEPIHAPEDTDTRAVFEHEKVNGICPECNKMTRHSIKCPKLDARRAATPTQVQDAACVPGGQVPE